MGIVGQMTTLAGLSMRDMYDEGQVIHMENCEVNSAECMTFTTITAPAMMCFELSYPAYFELTKETKLHLLMSVTPDAQLNDVAFTEGEDIFYILR